MSPIPKKNQKKVIVEEEKNDQKVVKAASKTSTSKSLNRSPALSKSPSSKFGKMSLDQSTKK
jgi:hypothetical protein